MTKSNVITYPFLTYVDITLICYFIFFRINQGNNKAFVNQPTMIYLSFESSEFVQWILPICLIKMRVLYFCIKKLPFHGSSIMKSHKVDICPCWPTEFSRHSWIGEDTSAVDSRSIFKMLRTSAANNYLVLFFPWGCNPTASRLV